MGYHFWGITPRDGPNAWLSLFPSLMLFCLFGGCCFGLAFSIRKLRVPDSLEFSPDKFRYCCGGTDVCGPWREVGAPETRLGPPGWTLLHLEVAGQPLEFLDGYFGQSMTTMHGVINAARAGHIISPDAWLADHPEQDDTKNQIIGVGAVLLVVACILILRLTVWRH